MAQPLIPGQRALVVGQHPHAGRFVTLVSFGPYGLEILKLEGWLVREDDGTGYYAKAHELASLAGDDQQLASLAGGDQLLAGPPDDDQDVEALEAEELPATEGLEPTISPRKRENTLDRLRAYYKAPEDAPVLLTKRQQAVLKRLEAAWGLLLDAKTSEKAAKKLMQVFKISRPQAYRDLGDCKQLFGDVVKSSREADRYLLREMALDTYSKAKKAGELGEMNKSISTLVKITGIEKADPNIPEAEDLLPSNYLLELQSSSAAAGGKGLTLNLEAIADLPAHEYENVLDIIQHSGNTPLQMLQRINEAARGTTE